MTAAMQPLLRRLLGREQTHERERRAMEVSQLTVDSKRAIERVRRLLFRPAAR
jgi:hypothetical protein